ncbi:MAG: Adenylate kinase, partial [uncultured Rubrobacteraceae bacterium]
EDSVRRTARGGQEHPGEEGCEIPALPQPQPQVLQRGDRAGRDRGRNRSGTGSGGLLHARGEGARRNHPLAAPAAPEARGRVHAGQLPGHRGAGPRLGRGPRGERGGGPDARRLPGGPYRRGPDRAHPGREAHESGHGGGLPPRARPAAQAGGEARPGRLPGTRRRHRGGDAGPPGGLAQGGEGPEGLLRGEGPARCGG